MLMKTAFQARVDRNLIAERQPLQLECAPELPDVPVLRETLLLLELEVQELSVDLRNVSFLVLGDPGATLQILRRAGDEYGNAEGRPTRIEDCISDLGIRTCLEAVSAHTVAGNNRHTAIAETWAHSREIAHYSKLVAEESAEVNPEDAYLVGLLHTTGLLPAMLGWDWRESRITDSTAVGFSIANKWSLPRCVIDFFCEMHLAGYATRWSGIVREAHQRANRSSIHCPFEREIGPRLYRNS